MLELKNSLRFRKHELISIDCPDTKTKEALYRILSGEQAYDLKMNGVFVQSNIYRKLLVGTTSIEICKEDVQTILQYELTFKQLTNYQQKRHIKNALYQVGYQLPLYEVYEELDETDQLKIQLAKAIVKKPKVILIDFEISDDLAALINDLADECLVIVFSEYKNADRFIKIEDHQIVWDSQPYTQKQRSEGIWNMPECSLTLPFFYKRVLQNLILFSIVLMILWFEKEMSLFCIVGYLWFLSCHGEEIKIFKKLGASYIEVFKINNFHILIILLCSGLICLLFNKLDIVEFIRISIWWFLVSGVYIKLK